MATDTSKITGAADDLSDKLTKGGSAAKTLGAEIANAFKSLDDRVTALEAGGTAPPIEPPPIEPPPVTSTDGRITNFTATNGQRFEVDGIQVLNQNAGKSWNIVKVDDYMLQFEVRPGDVWTSGSYVDRGCNRSEIEFQNKFRDGQQSTMTEKMTIMPGPKNTSGWFDLSQVHSTAQSGNTPSPFYLNLNKEDKLEIVLQNPRQGNLYPWKSPQPVVRGQEMDIKVTLTMGPSGGGKVEVWIDSARVLNYSGEVGAPGGIEYYWKVGTYRGEVPETAIARYRNIHIVNG